MWIMILLAVHTNDPQDQPGRIALEFPGQAQCQTALATMQYELKFKSFQVQGQCVEKSSSSQTMSQTK